MNAPTCPTHGKALSPPKKPGQSWFCATKMSDGTWCPYKVKAEAPNPQPGTIVQPGATLAPQVLSDEAIRLRIWETMAKLFQGSGMPDEALHNAQKAFDWIKAKP